MLNKKYFIIGLLGVLLFFIFIPSVLSQDFDRVIELRTPTRMNGKDILSLQNRLLSFGFSGIGEADGYYGPLAERIIKGVQVFSGFEVDGKVNRALWNYIFDNSNTVLLQGIAVVLTYDQTRLVKTREFTDNAHEQFSSTFVYYSSIDKKAKILVNYSGGESLVMDIIYYYVNDVYYFIDYKNNFGSEEKILVDNGRYFIIINGTLNSYSNSTYWFDKLNIEKNILIAEHL